MNEVTVKELAKIERVSERTVWNWIAKGAVDVRRTPGGGIRIATPGPVLRLQSPEKQGNPSR